MPLPACRRSSATSIYVRPGLGLAIHNGSTGKFQPTDRIAFGSRVLFEPEIGVGDRLSERLRVEASWVHMSHAQLFARQNPGIDNHRHAAQFKLVGSDRVTGSGSVRPWSRGSG